MQGKFFKDAIKDKKLTIRKVAGMLGMRNHSQLSSMLAGDRRMQLDEAIGLSQILGIPLLDVIAQAGFPDVMQNGRRVPVVGILRGNGTVEEVPPNTERAVAPSGLADDGYAIQARTSESPLSWLDRSVFFCGERNSPDDGDIGHLCHIKLDSGECVVGTLRRGYEPNTYSISGPFQLERAKVEWVSRIMLTRH